MRFIDSHCHLHDSRIIADLPGIEDRARTAGVDFMVTCATMENNFELTARISKDFHSIIPCFGIHPWFVETASENWQTDLENYLVKYNAGIGETGIDFVDKTCNRDLQVLVFKEHLALARELNRPINIHVRKAWDTFIHILKTFGRLDSGGLIHSYSGSADMIPLFEKYGLYISFSGSVTNPGAKKVVNALKQVSQNRVVLETDTPDIYPHLPEGRKKRLNEPENLPAICRIAADRIKMDAEQFSRNTYQNSLRLFKKILPKGNT
ncbi:MAG: TatD family hydrolase [Desulfobacteraceae bacterium]|nr:TatD family hydrolase [Desulfobacteraceae bacterium]